jgi:hypothetical protein
LTATLSARSNPNGPVYGLAHFLEIKMTTTFKYIGQKDVERAFEEDTGIAWLPGEEHEIKDEAIANKMKKYDGVWQVVETKPAGLADAKIGTGKSIDFSFIDGKEVDMTAMDKTQLHAIAKTMGVVVHANAGADTVRTAIIAAQAAK